MRTLLICTTLFAAACTSALADQAQPASVQRPSAQSAPIVFFDIAGPDAAKLKSFYAGIFNWTIDAANGITTPGVRGTLRQDPPETLLYLGVSDIEATLKSVTASGGSVVLPRTVVPNIATFAIFKDPAGNRMGLVELRK